MRQSVPRQAGLPWGSSDLSWKSALCRAALLEMLLGAFVLFLLSGRIPLFPGADNPLAYYAAFILQFPGSLLALALPVSLSPVNGGLTHCVGGFAIGLAEFLVIAVFLRKPWVRRKA